MIGLLPRFSPASTNLLGDLVMYGSFSVKVNLRKEGPGFDPKRSKPTSPGVAAGHGDPVARHGFGRAGNGSMSGYYSGNRQRIPCPPGGPGHAGTRPQRLVDGEGRVPYRPRGHRCRSSKRQADAGRESRAAVPFRPQRVPRDEARQRSGDVRQRARQAFVDQDHPGDRQAAKRVQRDEAAGGDGTGPITAEPPPRGRRRGRACRRRRDRRPGPTRAVRGGP